MKIIIPLAGKGTRLRPLTHTKAKPLVCVAGKPVLGHILDSIVKQKNLKIDEIIFIVGYLGEQIESHFGNGSRLGVRIRYSPEKNPPDTGERPQDHSPTIRSNSSTWDSSTSSRRSSRARRMP